MGQLIQLRVLFTDLRVVLAFCVAVAALVFHLDRRVDGQEPPVESLPVVTLVGLPFADVREGSTLSITVKINPTLSVGDPSLEGGKLTGGIIVWDPHDIEFATSLIALAFFPGDETDVVSYTVPDDGVTTTDRRIRIAINPVFDVYAVGDPSEATVRVLDKGDHPTPDNLPASAHGDTYSHADTDTDSDANTYADAHTHTNSDAHTYADADSKHLRPPQHQSRSLHLHPRPRLHPHRHQRPHPRRLQPRRPRPRLPPHRHQRPRPRPRPRPPQPRPLHPHQSPTLVPPPVVAPDADCDSHT